MLLNYEKNLDKEKCNGCRACVMACHEGAIEMINGKATLIRENHCDGLGDCLPACPANAICFKESDLLIAADCTAYAYGNFHNDFIKKRVTLIGCPKLDEYDYSKKLAAIISNNKIKSITVARMEVPCCC